MTIPNELIHPSPFDLLNDLDGKDIIHRYCNLAEFDALLEKKLTLTCPNNWSQSDPFENPIFKADLIKTNGERHDMSRWSKQLQLSVLDTPR